jgi:plasmid stability protein
MGELRVRIDDSLLTKLEGLAQSRNMSLEAQVTDVLSKAVEPADGQPTFAEIARQIAAMTPKEIEKFDSVELLREDRNR